MTPELTTICGRAIGQRADRQRVQPLVDHPMQFLGGEGPAVRFVPCSRDEAMDVGDDQIDLLLDEGWRPEDLALLTTGSRHPEQAERQKDGHKAYWDTFWDTDQVFYGHVLGFKGLERRAVVVVVNEESKFERSRERLYVGLSRARDQLVVCGDPDFIREAGGPDLARRLNLPARAPAESLAPAGRDAATTTPDSVRPPCECRRVLGDPCNRTVVIQPTVDEQTSDHGARAALAAPAMDVNGSPGVHFAVDARDDPVVSVLIDDTDVGNGMREVTHRAPNLLRCDVQRLLIRVEVILRRRQVDHRLDARLDEQTNLLRRLPGREGAPDTHPQATAPAPPTRHEERRRAAARHSRVHGFTQCRPLGEQAVRSSPAITGFTQWSHASSWWLPRFLMILISRSVARGRCVQVGARTRHSGASPGQND